MMPYGDKIAIRAEGEGLYELDPVTYEITLVGPNRLETFLKCRLFADAGFLHISPTRFLISGGIDPLIFILSGGHGVCSYDLDEKKFTKAYRAPLSGALDIALVPDRDEILASSIWRDKIWVISSNDLKHLRTLKIGPCVRPVAYDPKKKLGYTVECFSGNLVAFDVVTGEIRDRRYVGKNARKIYVFEDLGTIILSGCGVLRLRE